MQRPSVQCAFNSMDACNIFQDEGDRNGCIQGCRDAHLGHVDPTGSLAYAQGVFSTVSSCVRPVYAGLTVQIPVVPTPFVWNRDAFWSERRPAGMVARVWE